MSNNNRTRPDTPNIHLDKAIATHIMHLINQKGCIMVKSTTKAVRKSVEKAGKKRRSFNLSPDHDAVLTCLVGQYGTMQAVFEAGLHALSGRNQPTNNELLAKLGERLQNNPEG